MRRVGELPLDRLPVVIDIDPDNFITRHHDVIHADLFQIENRQQHILIAARDLRTGFMHDSA
ncbi:Uncharacterised protein [Salmonella enterica subsp. enterica serovar Bovismorbificans]|uniref:Uncharacterized protein n=1 Tax=Salmonella enterica subsp. enterica serovar Bovismorbificans TaxID=58097 RepID=A0A655CWI7_SALET|nr:Uncharacterised protein [Salmonella enterica subsp. enterica serovar Bovismorbificans]